MNSVLPAIFEKDFTEIEKKLERVRPFAKAVHIDLLDGKFIDNVSFLDPEPFKKYSQDFYFELHMMVEEPEAYIEKWAENGFKRFVGHIEKMSDQSSFVARAQEYGEVGLALDLKTSGDEIKVQLQDLDMLLVMGVNAGYSGQVFEKSCLQKISFFSQQNIVPVEVDGGVNIQSITQICQSGASRVAVTSALFAEGEIEENFQELESNFNEQAEWGSY